MVNFEDVIDHTLSNLEDAARKDNAKLCRTLAQNLVREILAPKNTDHRRKAVEKGVVQSIVVILKQFSFDGTEKRDQTTRSQLVGVCLDILLDLKSYVKLDDNENVPICILLRTYGVHVVVNSMVMHWSLKSRSVTLFAQSLRVLYNIGTSEQGTRMLLDSQVHGILMGVLEKDNITDRDILYLIVRILVTMVLFRGTSRTLFGRDSSSGVSRIQLLLKCAGYVSPSDFVFHRELNCLLCMISTKQEGAMSILKCESSLGYIVQVLHHSTSALNINSSSGISNTATDTTAGEHQQQQSQLVEGINNTVQNAVSAGSNLITNFMRRQGPNSQQQQHQHQQQSQTQNQEVDSKMSDARRIACWSSMLLHNLCKYSYQDIQMRMVISQAYETSNASLGTAFDRPLYQQIMEAMKAICELEAAPSSPDLLLSTGTSQKKRSSLGTTFVDQIVENIVAESTGGKDDDYCGRTVLLNIDYLRLEYGGSVSLHSVLSCLLERLTSLLAETDANSLPPSLPISTEASRILSFLFLLVTHPLLQRRLSSSPECLSLVLGDNSTDKPSFIQVLREVALPEYFGIIERSFQSLIDIETRRIRVYPLLPYRSFQTRQAVMLKRQSSNEPMLSAPSGQLLPTIKTGAVSPPPPGPHQQQHQSQVSSPEAPHSVNSKSKTPPGSASSSPTGKDVRDNRASSVATTSPSKQRGFGLKQQRANSARELRRKSNPYVPSHSNMILSPLLHDINTKDRLAATQQDEEVQQKQPASSLGSLSAPGTSPPLSSSVGSLGSLLAHGAIVEPAFNLYDWCDQPDVVAVQTSLRIERLYMAVDPCRLIVLGAKGPCDEVAAELRFLQECDKLVYFFKGQILEGQTSWVRARIVECIIDIASCAASATLRNASLVVCCLEALASRPVRRLELTWRNVPREKWQAYEELKALCGFEASNALDSPKTGGTSIVQTGSDDGTEDGEDFLRPVPISINPTPFLSGARLPYIAGIISSLRQTRARYNAVNIVPINSETELSTFALDAEVPPPPVVDLLSEDVDRDPVNSEVEEDGSKDMLSDKKSEKGEGDFDPLGLFSATDSGNSTALDSKVLLQYQSSSKDEEDVMFSSPFPDDDFFPQEQSRHIDFGMLHQQYQVIARWISTTRSNGDWFQRVYSHQPDVQLQICLKTLACRPSQAEERNMEQVSLRQEPPWSLNQMLLESLYAIEGWIESLFESSNEEEGKVIRAFRSSVRNLDNGDGSNPFLETKSNTSSARFRSLGETANAAAQMFRSGVTVSDIAGGGGVSAGSTTSPPRRNSSGGGSSEKSSNRSLLHTLPKIPPAATGKLINSLVRKITGVRRERLLQESGSRSAEHWDKIVDHVRLCVERIVLAPILSRLLLGAIQDHIEKECALQERVLILKNVPLERLVDVLGLPKRNNLNRCTWDGAVATLKGFNDVSMPSLKLKVLLRLKDEIYREAAEHSVMDMNADEFLPVMTYIILKADLKHSYATTMMLRELLSDEFVSGEAAYYLTTFEIALGHLLGMTVPEDIVAAEYS